MKGMSTTRGSGLRVLTGTPPLRDGDVYNQRQRPSGAHWETPPLFGYSICYRKPVFSFACVQDGVQALQGQSAHTKKALHKHCRDIVPTRRKHCISTAETERPHKESTA